MHGYVYKVSQVFFRQGEIELVNAASVITESVVHTTGA